ncbi:efflux RND transporter periplasmic adaptor subunit [Sodalis ligni]|uniref:Multidrug efflux system membrane fusion protein n=1 Tax=Sodalis ligni TaxID=2697027 RepID=A0A4R1N8S3_9GAMM|nr:efflux RND transporter periplasmic adaptor subunit [Sodalis ligni]TCL03047.1 multidrug efflux system membrane fusion protein [Sodalis ligni]
MTDINVFRYPLEHARYSLVLPAVLLALQLAGCDAGSAVQTAPPPPSVSVAPVLLKQIEPLDTFNGRVEAVQSVQLRPRVSGYIDRVNFKEGQEVHKGDVLFTIDDRTYRAALQQAKAELASAVTQAKLARSESGRTEKLLSTSAVSAEQGEQRRSAAEQAQANVLSAQAAVDTAQLNMDFTRVTAPIDGRAGSAQITAGNLVTAGDSASVLTTLVSLDTVYVYFDVDESTFLRYQGLARGNGGNRPQEVHIALVGEEGYPHTGKIDFLDNQLAPSTGTIRMRALLDNRDRRFTPGLFARVQLPASQRFNAMLIDDKAVVTDQDRKFVYVLDSTGKAQRRDITPGREFDGMLVVQEGLAPGDRVVIDGVQKIFMPGMPVNAKNVPMTSAPAATVLN